eukprot:568577-Pyramimonas_sp.AAC.1
MHLLSMRAQFHLSPGGRGGAALPLHTQSVQFYCFAPQSSTQAEPSRPPTTHPRPCRYLKPLHWVGAWMLAETMQRMHGVESDSSTVVMRSRPDVCFRDCFNFTAAAKVRDDPATRRLRGDDLAMTCR